MLELSSKLLILFELGIIIKVVNFVSSWKLASMFVHLLYYSQLYFKLETLKKTLNPFNLKKKKKNYTKEAYGPAQTNLAPPELWASPDWHVGWHDPVRHHKLCG